MNLRSLALSGVLVIVSGVYVLVFPILQEVPLVGEMILTIHGRGNAVG